MAQTIYKKGRIKVGKWGPILDTARRRILVLDGYTIGYIAELEDDIARVIFYKVSTGEHSLHYEGRWWRLSDLKNLEVSKWRRQEC